jgi:hypothetical protein
MLKPKSPQASFYGSYLHDRIVPPNHLLRKINQVVDFSFVNDLLRDRYNPDFGRPAEDPEFMLRLCLLQYPYGDSDREVVSNARFNLGYKYFLGLAASAGKPVTALRRGSTGRMIDKNSIEQAATEHAIQNPSEGIPPQLKAPVRDPRRPANEWGQKWALNINGQRSPHLEYRGVKP